MYKHLIYLCMRIYVYSAHVLKVTKVYRNMCYKKKKGVWISTRSDTASLKQDIFYAFVEK